MRRARADSREPAGAEPVLEFTLNENGGIEAKLDFGAGAKRKETWTLQVPGGGELPPFADGDPELPRFGEYVFVEELPEAVERVRPYYPEDARARGIEGTVMVQALIGRDGTVRDMRIAKSIPELDRVAAACVWLWRFKPAMAQGKPVAVWVAVPVTFALH